MIDAKVPGTTTADPRLIGTTLMLVESDWFPAGYITSLLELRSSRVPGPTNSTAKAMAVLALGERPHAAAVATNLAEGSAWPLVDVLVRLDIPVLLLAEQHDNDIPAHLSPLFVVNRPCSAHDVATTLADLHVSAVSAKIVLAFKAAAGVIVETDSARHSREGLFAATRTYVRLYGRPPSPGETEAICESFNC